MEALVPSPYAPDGRTDCKVIAVARRRYHWDDGRRFDLRCVDLEVSVGPTGNSEFITHIDEELLYVLPGPEISTNSFGESTRIKDGWKMRKVQC